MIWRPDRGGMWDPSVLWHDGRYHVFVMYRKEGDKNHGHCFHATSEDGVHWKDEGVVLEERERAKGYIFFKCFVARCGDRFIMNHGVAATSQDVMRFYESTDLRSWRYLFSNRPDPRWYNVPPEPTRWDHMYMLPKEEGNPGAGYWGFPVSAPKPFDRGGVGRMQSPDGLTWEILPPARFDWPEGIAKTNHFEWGGCERIGGRYYLIGGLPEYFDNNGYAIYTFTAESPEGPFRPDPTAFRLCGNSPGGRLTWLAAWCRGKDDELLISNYSSPAHGENARPWMLPLRRPLVDGAGHLRLAWWKGNEALKGEPLPLGEEAVSLRGGEGEAAYRTVWLDRDFDLARGVLMEGSLRADGEGPSPAVGFVFDEKPGEPAALLMGVGGPRGRETHIGRLQADERGGVTFASEDVTGKRCATVTGIEGGREHRFRLLVRMTFFELYVDDLLVQTFVYRPTSGRLGFVTREARLAASGLEARQMSLPAEPSFDLGPR